MVLEMQKPNRLTLPLKIKKENDKLNWSSNIALKTCEFNKSEFNIKHLFVCCYYFRTITKKGFFPCLFGHSLVAGLWFGGAIAVYSIMKVNRLHEPSP